LLALLGACPEVHISRIKAKVASFSQEFVWYHNCIPCDNHFTLLPGATTHAGSWSTQETASIHLCLWSWPSRSWLPTSLRPSSLHQSILGFIFLLVFCPPSCPR